MKKNVLALDIGNVCIRINHNNCAAELELEKLPSEICSLFRDYEWGRIKDEKNVFEQASQIFGSRFTPEKLLAAFNSILIEAIPGMDELVRDFPSLGVQAVFFSDISPTHLERTKKLFPAFPLVSDGIFSFDVGDWKPSEAMFSTFEHRFGIPDLYVDDRPELIAAAGKRGWNSAIFAGAMDLRKKLAALS